MKIEEKEITTLAEEYGYSPESLSEENRKRIIAHLTAEKEAKKQGYSFFGELHLAQEFLINK